MPRTLAMARIWVRGLETRHDGAAPAPPGPGGIQQRPAVESSTQDAQALTQANRLFRDQFNLVYLM